MTKYYPPADELTVQFADYPPAGSPRGFYILWEDYDEYIDGPFSTASEAEAALEQYGNDWEPPDPWEHVEFPFAENH